MTGKNPSRSHGDDGNSVVEGTGGAQGSGADFKFTKMFPCLHPLMIKKKVAEEVGKQMIATSDLARKDSNIPAGYTYFGQFIDHDITRDITVDDGVNPTPVEDLVQSRSPTLDLDSVYGRPSKDGHASPRTEDNERFMFATTIGAEGGGRSKEDLNYDLHRKEITDKSRAVKSIALIPDGRNDENLIVAQMHAAWMRFHNSIATALRSADASATPEDIFNQAKILTTKHYQYIVLHDFLKRICDPDVYDDVVKRGNSRHFTATSAELPKMPIEFSVAAFRMGHSMVRDSYEWNLNFSTNGNFKVLADFSTPPSEFGPTLSLFAFTSKSGFLKKSLPLPTNWIVDWRNLFDFSDTDFKVKGVTPQMASALDPHIASGMGSIPGETRNLATANLRRSGLRGLPSGQEVANSMGATRLTRDQMARGLDPSRCKLGDLVRRYQFGKQAPLWFYILQEANIQGGGNHLGEVGSRILCETFVALINASEPSILQEGWRPKASAVKLRNGKSINTLSRMLAFVDETVPIINPLEDPRSK